LTAAWTIFAAFLVLAVLALFSGAILGTRLVVREGIKTGRR
jgi:hypothetical protein